LAEAYPHPEPKAKKDFFVQFNAMVDHHLPLLSKTETHVLLKFMRWSDADWQTFKSAQTIAKDLGCTLRSVQLAIETLKRIGMVELVALGGGATFTTYRVTVPPVKILSLVDGGTSENPCASPVKILARTSEKRRALLNKEDQKLDQKHDQKKARGKNPAVFLPLSLQTENFRKAWQDWTQYRRELKKPLTPSTIRAQLKKLEQAGEPAAIESIHSSISNGWQGLFPEVTKNGNTNRKSRAHQRRNGEFAEPEIIVPGLERSAARG
jgi:hypothetical protein